MTSYTNDDPEYDAWLIVFSVSSTTTGQLLHGLASRDVVDYTDDIDRMVASAIVGKIAERIDR